jgi:hypothetical protein
MTRRKVLGLIAVSVVGCARSDWVESTLVTVDVTGHWTGYGGAYPIELVLRQRGAIVQGELTAAGPAQGVGPVEGTLSGDVLRLRQMNGTYLFNLTAAGDEMTGSLSTGVMGSLTGRTLVTLRRRPAGSAP